jgi:cell division protein FtsI (penicillin-binding protein 3)
VDDRKRLVVLAVFLSLLFSSLIFRFYQLQILEGERWSALALAQHQTILLEPGLRGCFYSRDEHPLVLNVPAFHLCIDPELIPEETKNSMAEGIARLIGSSYGTIRGEFYRKSRSRRIAKWLSREEKERIEQWWHSFYRSKNVVRNALFFTPEMRRSYPFGTLLGAVLHTVQEEKDPQTQQHIPTGGLELMFHSILSGKTGKRQMLRSPRNTLDTGIVLEEAKQGADLYLTIDHYLQAIAEDELAKGVQAVGAKGGWVVMMDPHSGEILALAQVPSFDPAHYAYYFDDPERMETTRVRAITDCFEPGSIFKPIMLLLCLQANEELKREGKKPLFSPEEKVATAHGTFPGRSTPLKDGRVHRFLNMELAVQKSSNVYMGHMMHRLTERMGPRWIRDHLLMLGFGQKTQIELPAEQEGHIPTPGKLHPNGALEWSAPTPYSLGMGHNILINTLQVARVYAMIANGGYAVTPHLVRKIVRKNEVLLDRTGKDAFAQVRLLTPSVTEPLLRALKYTTKPGGTSVRADVMGYSEAGKSGTSEKIIAGNYSNQQYFSSFVGFTPAHQPRFVLMVVIDEPERKLIPGVGKQHHGGVCATPVFREIATRALQYLGVEPDDPYGYSTGDPRRNVQRADWMAETEALKKRYDQWNLKN